MDTTTEASLILACLKDDTDYAQNLIDSGTVRQRVLYSLAEKNLVRAYLSEFLLKLRLPDSYPLKLFATVLQQNALVVDILRQQARHCERALAERGIPMLVLKGLTIPCDYPRDINDLDIMIREKDLVAAAETLTKAGYRYVGDDLSRIVPSSQKGNIVRQSLWNNEYLFKHGQSGLLIELHTNLFPRTRVFPQNLNVYLDSVEDLWSRAVDYPDIGLKGLCREDLFLLLCVHGSVKRCPGKNRFAIRTCLDLAAVIGKGLDWETVIMLARRYRIAEHLFLGFAILSAYFPASVPDGLRKRVWQAMPRRFRFLERIHFAAFDGLGESKPFFAYVYRLIVPFFYGGTPGSRLSFAYSAAIHPLRKIKHGD